MYVNIKTGMFLLLCFACEIIIPDCASAAWEEPTGKPFKRFGDMRPRELLANWLLCVVLNFGDDNKVELVQSDFTKYEDKTKYDLIIGNPPYFVTSKK